MKASGYALVLWMLGCGGSTTLPQGVEAKQTELNASALPFSSAVEAASQKYSVPSALLTAVAWSETHFTLGVQPSPDHGYGPMHLREGGLLERAARASGNSIAAVETELGANLLAGAAILRELRDARVKNGTVQTTDTDLVSWYRDLIDFARENGAESEELQVLYADGIFAVLSSGAQATVGSENIVLSASHVAPPGVLAAAEIIKPLGLAGDYPGASWLASPNYNSRGGTIVDTIVIHDTEGSYASTLSWFRTPASQVSAHYVVRSSDGAVTQMVAESNRAWHASCWNSRGLGVEHEGFRSQTGWYTEAMYQSSAKLTAFMANKWGIPKDRAHFRGHEELTDCNNHSDPGPNWDWVHYMDLVRGGPGCSVQGAILAAYSALGGAGSPLGACVTSELPCADGVGRYNHFKNGSIYWHPAEGAHAVEGAIATTWAAHGWETGLGYPLTDELPTSDKVGRFNHFSSDASIYWSPATGAHAVWHLIRAKWSALGWEQGLGYPLTDETPTPGGKGAYNHFSNSASIYWSAATGAHAVRGAIRTKWSALGWEAGLGFPTEDSTDTVGRFEKGAIVSNPGAGVHSLTSPFYLRWSALGDGGCLGWPTADAVAATSQLAFQHGSMTLDAAGHAVEHCQVTSADGGSGTPVSGGGINTPPGSGATADGGTPVRGTTPGTPGLFGTTGCTAAGAGCSLWPLWAVLAFTLRARSNRSGDPLERPARR